MLNFMEVLLLDCIEFCEKADAFVERQKKYLKEDEENGKTITKISQKRFNQNNN